MLQWGHALGAWKTFSLPTSLHQATALQWGHALGAWKTSRVKMLVVEIGSLQWGHALGAWKTGQFWWTQSEPNRFNGAML